VATLPEALLVLWALGRHLDLAHIPLLWAAASLVKMFIAMLAGAWSDRVGRLPVVAGGWAVRVACLLALAFAPGAHWLTWALFLAFAASLATTEAAERSLVGDAAAPSQRATAFGLYHLVCGLLALPGALLLGVAWQRWGQVAALLLAAGLTAAAAGGLLWLGRRAER